MPLKIAKGGLKIFQANLAPPRKNPGFVLDISATNHRDVASSVISLEEWEIKLYHKIVILLPCPFVIRIMSNYLIYDIKNTNKQFVQ